MANTTKHGGRLARLIDDSGEGWYHIYNRLACKKTEFPFKDQPEAKENLIRFLLYYGEAYRCEITTYAVMDNHFHFILRMDSYEELSQNDLLEAAKKFYPNTWKQTNGWGDDNWEQFNRRLFNVSDLMRNILQGFTKWYNKSYERRGRLWADRFKSTLLFGEEALLECMQYVDLNPLRGGLVDKPEEYKYGALIRRMKNSAPDLMPLNSILNEASEEEALTIYRSKVYLRGEIKSKDNDAVISESIIQEELAYDFEPIKKRKWRFMTDGLAIGAEDKIFLFLETLRKRGIFKRRKNPVEIPQYGGKMFSLREQRGHSRLMGGGEADPMWVHLGLVAKCRSIN